MKIFKYLLGMFVIASMFLACEDDYEPVSDFGDAGFYTSYGNTIARKAVVGDYAAFMDISQGAIYHHWAIDSGNYFIEGPIPRGEEDFIKYIINAGDTMTNEINANVLFAKGDTAFTVRLFNVFDDSVAWRGIDETVEWPYPTKNHSAVYQEDGEWAGKWVFEYNILVDVYDTIVTDMVLRQDGMVVDHTEDNILEIHVGDVLQFEDLSAEVDNTARPDERTWRVGMVGREENDPFYTSSTHQIADISFLQMGDFNVMLQSRRAAGEDISGDSEDYTMPLVIRVLQAEGPFIQDGAIKEESDGRLNVPFNALLSDAFDSNTNALFQVHIEGQPSLNITNIERVENNQNRLLLTLDGKLYQDDVVTLEYTKDETIGIKSQDERPAESFSVSVKLFDPNMLDLTAASFEDALGDVWRHVANGDAVVSYSDEQVASGDYSIKMVNNTGKARIKSDQGTLFSLTGGNTYIIRFKRFVTTGTASTADKLWIDGVQINKAVAVFDQTKLDSWDEIEIEYTPAADVVGGSLELQVNPGAATVYYDDFFIAPKVVRE